MALDSRRDSVDRYLTAMAKPFRKTNPNTLSALSLIFALGFGVFYYLSHSYTIIIAIILLILSSVFDAIDGKVARLRRMSSKRGDLVDHFFDRVADILMIVGMGLGAFSTPIYALVGLEGVLLTSYMGTQSQALGLGRDYAGVVGRADRLVTILIFAILQVVYPFNYHLSFLWLTPTTVVLLWFFIAGNITAAQRFYRSYKKLR